MRTRRKKIVRAFALIAAISAPAAFAEAQQSPPQASRGGTDGFQTAEALYQNCTGPSVHGREYCFAYIAAVADSVRAYQAWLNLSDVCVQKSVSHGALADTFTGYVQRNVSLGRNQAASVVVLSMQDRYPCVRRDAAAAPANGPVKPVEPHQLPAPKL